MEQICRGRIGDSGVDVFIHVQAQFWPRHVVEKRHVVGAYPVHMVLLPSAEPIKSWSSKDRES